MAQLSGTPFPLCISSAKFRQDSLQVRNNPQSLVGQSPRQGEETQIQPYEQPQGHWLASVHLGPTGAPSCKESRKLQFAGGWASASAWGRLVFLF